MDLFRSTVEPVLGTRLLVRTETGDPALAAQAEAAALAEADRLEAVLTAFRPESPFSRWRRGDLEDAPPEVVAVLRHAAGWHARSDGASNPNLGGLVRRWRRAEAEQRLPDPAEVADLALAAHVLPFHIVGARAERIGDCATLDVHGTAKGWVIDRMVEAALDTGAAAVLVDLGGDLRHASSTPHARPVDIAVEDPDAVADNAAPLTTISVRDQAVATSAGGRRGYRIGGRWYGHLLDPATGWPLDARRSATVVAPTAADADAAASAFAVLDRERAAALAAAEDLAVLVSAPGEPTWCSPAWPRGC